MKIRTGFVSNSSSSSFVVLGYAVPKGSITKKEAALKLGLVTEEQLAKEKYPEDTITDALYTKGAPMFADDFDDGAPYGQALIGVKIADISSESGTEEKEADFEAVLKEAYNIRTQLGIDPIIPLKLYTGTRQC